MWAETEEVLRKIEDALVELRARLDEVFDDSDAMREHGAEMASLHEYWKGSRARLSEAILRPQREVVYWLSGSRQGVVGLNAAPLNVSDALRDGLFTDPHAVTLVSATLAVDHSFDYVKNRLGLEEAEAVALGSPFDYRNRALLYVPHDMPDPTQTGYQQALERVLFDTIARIGGRTLVLFTSRAHLRATYRALQAPLTHAGITLLGQDVDQSSRTRLLESFRRGSRVTLFGTSSFWEGVDVVGDALSCVVVTRLPFAVPTDPVYAARSEQFEDPFGQFAVPQAVLRRKQGVGRLIRSKSDRGAVVVLDRRLVTRSYGRVFVRSLPDCTVREGPAARTAIVVEQWIEDDPERLAQTG